MSKKSCDLLWLFVTNRNEKGMDDKLMFQIFEFCAKNMLSKICYEMAKLQY